MGVVFDFTKCPLEEAIMFKKGDVVCLNELGIKNLKELPGFNPCLEKLLNGESIEVYDVIPQFQGSQHYSVLFYGGGYSFSPDYFKLA